MVWILLVLACGPSAEERLARCMADRAPEPCAAAAAALEAAGQPEQAVNARVLGCAPTDAAVSLCLAAARGPTTTAQRVVLEARLGEACDRGLQGACAARD